MTPRTVRVLLVEDSDVSRSTNELLLGLEGGISVVGAVASGEEAIDAVVALEPDVAVVDFRLPGMDGAETTTALRARRPTLAVVCLTAFPGDDVRRRMTDAGAAELVEKGEPIGVLASAVLTAAR